MRVLRTGTTVAVSLVVGAAVGAGVTLVLARDTEAPTLPHLREEQLTVDPATELPHTWTVQGDGPCDGYTLAAPVPQDASAGTARLVSTVIARSPTAVQVNLGCVGAVEDLGDPSTHVLAITSDPRTHVVETTVSPFGTAYRTESTMGSLALTEWWTEHDGMLWGAGVLHDPDDTASVRAVEAMLASWQWA